MHALSVLANLEQYVENMPGVGNDGGDPGMGIDRLGKLFTSPGREFDAGGDYLVGGELTVADLAVYNAIDECTLGPRGNQPQPGVEKLMREQYPRLMKTYDVVSAELSWYIAMRQDKFLS